MGEIEGGHEELLGEGGVVAAAEEKETHSFEIDPAQVTFCHDLVNLEKKDLSELIFIRMVGRECEAEVLAKCSELSYARGV